MKSIKIIALTTLILLGCIGCGVQEDIPTDDVYKADKEIIEYSLNTAIYQQAIGQIIYLDGGNRQDIDGLVSEYSDILTDEFIEILYDRSIEEEYEDNQQLDDDEFSIEEDIELPYLTHNNEDIELPEDTSSLEEDIESIEDEPVFNVTGIDAYSDRMIASVSYKYGAPMKVWVDLVGGKINGYKIYR